MEACNYRSTACKHLIPYLTLKCNLQRTFVEDLYEPESLVILMNMRSQFRKLFSDYFCTSGFDEEALYTVMYDYSIDLISHYRNYFTKYCNFSKVYIIPFTEFDLKVEAYPEREAAYKRIIEKIYFYFSLLPGIVPVSDHILNTNFLDSKPKNLLMMSSFNKDLHIFNSGIGRILFMNDNNGDIYTSYRTKEIFERYLKIKSKVTLDFDMDVLLKLLSLNSYEEEIKAPVNSLKKILQNEAGYSIDSPFKLNLESDLEFRRNFKLNQYSYNTSAEIFSDKNLNFLLAGWL